jgi:serine protease Do
MPQKKGVRTLFLITFALLLAHSAGASPNDPVASDSTSENLGEVQAAVVSVVGQNMEACVAISDGVGFGSGVIVSPDGLVLTAGHVVSGGTEQFELFFPSGRTVTARLVGYNLDVDSAMLRINGGGNWPSVKLAADDAPATGDWVVGLGHSGGYELGRKPPVRTGRVLELRGHLVVTDSVLIGGDSGGPLFNLAGELIGIHSSIGDVIAENRHVSMGTFRRDWRRLAAGERWGKLPELGGADQPGESDNSGQSDGQQESGDIAGNSAKATELGLTVRANGGGHLVIEQVQPGSPAARVGLKANDELLSIDGTRLDSTDRFQAVTSQLKPGSSVAIEFRRNGTTLRLSLILQNF